jgi:hypothetical protein
MFAGIEPSPKANFQKIHFFLSLYTSLKYLKCQLRQQESVGRLQTDDDVWRMKRTPSTSGEHSTWGVRRLSLAVQAK